MPPEEAVLRFAHPDLGAHASPRLVATGGGVFLVGTGSTWHRVSGSGEGLALSDAFTLAGETDVIDATAVLHSDDLWLLLATPGPALARVRPDGTVRYAVAAHDADDVRPVALVRLDSGALALVGERAIGGGAARQATAWILDDDLTVLRAARSGPWREVSAAAPIAGGVLIVGSERDPETDAARAVWGRVGERAEDDQRWRAHAAPVDGDSGHLTAVTRLSHGGLIAVGHAETATHLVRLGADGALRSWRTLEITEGPLTVSRVVAIDDGGWVALGAQRNTFRAWPVWFRVGANNEIEALARAETPFDGAATDVLWSPHRALVVAHAAGQLELSEVGPALEFTGACRSNLARPPRGVERDLEASTTTPDGVWEEERVRLDDRIVTITATTDTAGPTPRCP